MGKAPIIFSLAVLQICIFGVLFSDGKHVPESKGQPLRSSRTRRADDSDPVAAVVSQHSRDLAELRAELTALKARTSDLETAVGFTVYFSQNHVTGIGLNQPLVFDAVQFNAGAGYNKDTGIFTVPRSGTYVLALAIQRHGSDEDTLILTIKNGGTVIGAAEAGYSPFEHGAKVITVHLNEGDAISVQSSHGTTVYGGIATVFTGFRVSP